MIYVTLSISIIPGTRLAAMDHLKKLADIMRDNHGIDAMVLTPVSGSTYRVHVVTKYDSMAHAEQVREAFNKDESYGEWWVAAEGMFDWAGSTLHHYRVE